LLTIRAMSNGQGYSARHLEHSDYYAEGERVTGHWLGRGAELLGLAGEVKTADFEAVREGFDPATGEFLRQRESADRISTDGSTQSRGRNLYDFTISAPKSVSIMAVPGGDERLIEAHRTAVGEALNELETWAATRVRQDGANADRTTGNLVVAAYHHDTSRELDPQLHTHAVAANMTWDGTEGRWKALQASDIYARRAWLTEVYRNALAREVRGCGYQIEDRRDARGQDAGFEIRGVSDRLLETFSQRSRQRDDAIEEFISKNGRRPTDNEVAVLVRESRSDKLLEISTAEVRARQQARLTPEEVLALGTLREHALATAPARGYDLENAAPSLLYAREHLFERISVARDYELLTEALRHGRGRIALRETKGLLQLDESAGHVFRAGHEIATRESLERERRIVATVNRGIGRFEPLGAAKEFIASDRLRPEQKHAVEFVLGSRDRAVNIRGAAGAGKTATLAELNRGLAEAGQKALAVAPTMSAVEELANVGFLNAATIQRLLADERTQAEMRGGVLVVDEAGMVSARQMAELLAFAERQSVRIVFSGDTRQIQSVAAGDALRILEKESHLKSVSLTEVQRQTAREYREAIEELRRSPSRGFEKLQAIGAIHEVAFDERAQKAAEAWREAGSRLNAKGQPSHVLVVCATHDEIANVTHAIRAERKGAGELGESARAERLVPQNYTAAQKKHCRNFREGQILVFHRTAKGVSRNEALEVVRVEKRKLVARNAAGAERELTGKQAGCFEVYERREIELASRDRIVLTANRREPGFRATNGETVTVLKVDREGRIHLEDGRVLPASYRHFDYGYAVTAHRSQGKTVDAVVISADAMKRELFYVAASRGRESVTVVTSAKELLRECVARSGERQSAMELARKSAAQEKSAAPSIQRGPALARQIALQTVMRDRELPVKPQIPEQEIRHEQIERGRRLRRGHEYGIGR
jgi:conjugative relaxase-like TrwC/TraI family protein